jgi:hypothetical protein
LSAGDVFAMRQRIEGQNLQGIKKGTSSAESLTVSFYVKSSNTGTYICEFFDQDNSRHISKSYTINTANTWEKKTITVPPDTSGQFINGSGASLDLLFWLAAGSDRTSGTLNDSAWATQITANRAVGQLNLANASGNYWAVTGIQLETGEVATPFEMRSPAQELALCQRYYQKITTTATGQIFGSGMMQATTAMRSFIPFIVPTRVAPAVLETSGTASDYAVFQGESVINCTSVPSIVTSTQYGIGTDAAIASGGTLGFGALLRSVNSNAFLAWSAEL